MSIRSRSARDYSEPRAPRDYGGVRFAALLMLIGGWGGIYWLVTTQRPFVGERWLFFLLLHIAAAGTALPLLSYINARITPARRVPPPSGVIVRQSVWVGLFVVACAWLQIPRVLNAQLMFFLALVMVVIEVFLRARELPGERRYADD